MPLTDFQQQIADQFHAWEMVGRGDLPPVDDPISPEPPFRPFRGYKIRRRPVVDDGTRHTLISRFLASTRPPEPEPEPVEEEDEEFDFDFCDREDQTELLILATSDWSPDVRQFAEFILQLEELQKPVAMEVVGTAEQTELLVTVENEDANRVEALITTCFPELVVHRKSREHDALLGDIWSDGPTESEIIEVALSRAFFLPLAEPRLSALSAMVGALSQLDDEDIGVVQILFEPARRDWSWSLTQGLLDDEATGRVFSDQQKLVRAAPPEIRPAPKAGTSCPHSGFSRSKLNQLILPSKDNDYHPPVKSVAITQPGKKRGARMIVLSNLLEYLDQCQEAGPTIRS